MSYWTKSEPPREDLRVVQVGFDAEGRRLTLEQELAQIRAEEPPLAIFAALLVALFATLVFGLAALPSIGSGL